jgi:hypothetical protein
MSETAKHKSPFRIELDGEIVTLPGRTLRSVLGMFAHLEGLAVNQEKELAEQANQKAMVKTFPSLLKRPSFDEFNLGGTSFRELGRQVVRTAKSQVRVLQTRTQEIQSLVLINNWSVAEKLWARLLPDCKTPLFALNFLEELWAIAPDALDLNGWSLAHHWHQFVLIQAQVEIILARHQNLVELSDALENQLGVWLKKFGEILERLDEESAA